MSWHSKTERVLDHCMNAFGVGQSGTFTYCAREGAEFACRGIFDNAYQPMDPNTRAPIGSVQPVLGIKLSDLPRAPRAGDEVIVLDERYLIQNVEKDVHGGALLMLEALS